jgi:hypothetical protein
LESESEIELCSPLPSRLASLALPGAVHMQEITIAAALNARNTFYHLEC